MTYWVSLEPMQDKHTWICSEQYPSGAHWLIPGTQWVACCSIINFLCSVCPFVRFH